MQYRVLALLVRHVGVVLTRSILLMQIWGNAPEMDPRNLDTHVNWLSRKLRPYADQYIETVHVPRSTESDTVFDHCQGFKAMRQVDTANLLASRVPKAE